MKIKVLHANMKIFSRKTFSALLDYSPSKHKKDIYSRPFTAVIYAVAKLGDGISCSIIVNAIFEAHPDCKLIVVCAKYNRASFEFIPNVELVEVSHDKNYLDMFLAAKKIKKCHPFIDFLIEPNDSNKNGPIVFMRTLKAYKNVTFRNKVMKMFGRVISHGINEEKQVVTRADEIVKAMRSHGFMATNEKFVFHIDPMAENTINKFLCGSISKDYIAINLYGSGKRVINNDAAIKIINEIICNFNIDVVLLCDPNTSKNVNEISSKFDDVFCYHETKTIHESAAIIKKARCLISPDTSLVHVAGALDVPTLAVFIDKWNQASWPPTATVSMSVLCEDMNKISYGDISPFLDKVLGDCYKDERKTQ
ncbi:glycosyltransferase family 9 protein [Aeromonas caviae]|uniref:glycosyltransferase family 9 protein n=1 Tax=Aeromonas caviae TaxID=648 RepID=UPI0025B733CA|nr:glycosyltransferase family 9 protein [Aeromonas caviae]